MIIEDLTQDGDMGRKLIIKDIVIVCLAILFIMQTFWTIKRQTDLTFLENRNSVLVEENKIFDKKINELIKVADSSAIKVSNLKLENDLMLADYNELLNVIKNYERDINNQPIPTIPNDSFQNYFAKYKYNIAESAMGGNTQRFGEGKAKSGANNNVKRSPGTGGCD